MLLDRKLQTDKTKCRSAESRDNETPLKRFCPVRLPAVGGAVTRNSLSVGLSSNMGSFYLQPSRALRSSSINLPEFLIPAFHNAKKARPFSTSQPCAFRVGGAPITLPPGVTLKLNEPPVRRKNVPTRIERLRLIEVEGPLGIQAQTNQ